MTILHNNKKIAGIYQEQVIPLADTINSGTIKIATQEDINLGEDNTKAVTPYYLNTKQNVLTSGNNIEINNNVIECQITPDNNTIIQNTDKSFTVVGQKTKSDEIKVNWTGTLAEYEHDWSNGIIQPEWYCYITDDEVVVDFMAEINNLKQEIEKLKTQINNINSNTTI